MKVTLISGEYPPLRGGVADYTALLAGALAHLGVDVGVLTSKRATTTAGRTGPVEPVVDSWGLGLAATVAEHIRRARPDLLHVQYQTGAFDMRLGVNLLPWVSRLRRSWPPIVVTFHDLREPYILPKLGPARHLATMLLAAGSDAVVVTNPDDFRRIADEAGTLTRLAWGRRPLWSIPIGSNIPPNANPHDARRIRERMGARPDDWVICFFGFVGPAKGVDDLVAAFRILVERGRPVRLVLVGATAGDSGQPDRIYENAIRQQLDDPWLRGRVTWTGFLQTLDVGHYLDAADVCCLPFRDGVSIRHGTLVAAITRGLAIVSTSSSAGAATSPFPAIVPDENAILVPPMDAPKLADGLERLLLDRALRERVRGGALGLAAAFDWQSIASRTVQLYDSVLG